MSRGFVPGGMVLDEIDTCITTQIDEIREFVMVKGIHILAINKTKLSSDIPGSVIAINDFELERLDRNEHGGGVAFYIKDTINY